MATVALAFTASDVDAANLRRLIHDVGLHTATSVSVHMEGHTTVNARMESHKITSSKIETHKASTQAKMDSHKTPKLKMEGHKAQAKLEGARVAGTWNAHKSAEEPVVPISPQAVVPSKDRTPDLEARTDDPSTDAPLEEDEGDGGEGQEPNWAEITEAPVSTPDPNPETDWDDDCCESIPDYAKYQWNGDNDY